jgi:hypothetical protein
VAKKTHLYAVKVMTRYWGTRISSILDGIMYVANNRTQNCPNGSVVNISFDAFAEARSILDAVRITFSQKMNRAKLIIHPGKSSY